MKLLITGASGHSGRMFIEILKSNTLGYDEIHVVVRNNDLDDLLRNSGLNFVKHNGDLEDIEFLNDITKNIDTILHIAGIQMSDKLFNVAVRNNVNWIIGVHTTGRYSQFKSASGEYIEIEDNLLKLREKINITILRPTMIYGSSKDRNMYKLVRFIHKSPVFPVFGNGNNLMQPVTAKDLAIAYSQVLENYKATKNNNYNLSGKYAIKYNHLIKEVANNMNKKIKLIHIPIKLSYYLVFIAKKIISRFPLNEEQVLRMKEDKDFTHLKATEDFGYNPMSFEEGIKEEINEYKRNIK
ncbi:NAD(P)-dependent oxidoreductase [Staphylococcus saprophyticus]|uniref:NAD-dependent epimerase/dehydratase family protein n=1 Tax=Staphylococcus saprophyticus TaxID=29385 RepID=UPI000FF8865B|nr:NAD(P)-dependent oxidoreductase [Staphylococcus saprophyticus]MDW4099700.1 NAD(P)-dependent oxidoreductase [Staphylococcus saprophyticus]MDW4158950.1 NAD(P)-dependent oxidoreductase [Staphylococcus saprophyticus]MDW4161877.1 NAD(P)-dependent oxidoreductase [Staphylococcus saprophyticus]MDW4423657.1 NAD(P)-dependent oxidoreductase [Staphylococcus saprophyticus]MDW4433155.1 NAD(P)-dependent oxidoreductase [Staphylococcus saprophyticus]